jgi:hypothetical protein
MVLQIFNLGGSIIYQKGHALTPIIVDNNIKFLLINTMVPKETQNQIKLIQSRYIDVLSNNISLKQQ